jgi:acyl carrier protein
MFDQDHMRNIVYRAIDQLNEVSLEENAILKRPDTILIGEGACLDSMGFVNFVVALESEFKQATGLELSLVERLNPSVGQPAQVRTLADLVKFLQESGAPSGEPSGPQQGS